MINNTDNVADQVAFGYFWPRGCQTALHLNHAKSTAYSFEYVAVDAQEYEKAEGNGCDDDHDALQALIDANLGALYFPTGKYRINSTLVFGNQTGHHLIGSGMPQLAAPDPSPATTPTPSNAIGARAAIVWGGDTSGTMIDYHGTGLIWDGLALWGTNPSNCGPTTTPKAAVGIKISKPSAGSLLNTGKIWFPAVHINNCETAIYADGEFGAHSCAFGYFRPRACDTCVHLDGTGATMFTFRFVLPQGSLTVFKVEGGGRIYVDSINAVVKNDEDSTVLDVVGSDMNNGFYHINALTGDGTVDAYHVLKNVDSGDGLQHFRFTNAHLLRKGEGARVAHVKIDRRNGNGQSVLEFVGCRGLTEAGQALTTNVVIKGASSAKPSRLIVRDSGIANEDDLIDAPNSSHYTENRIKNWTFAGGVQSST